MEYNNSTAKLLEGSGLLSFIQQFWVLTKIMRQMWYCGQYFML